jgi:hypothetical protein
VLISKAQIYKVWDAKKTLKGKKNPAIRVIDPKVATRALKLTSISILACRRESLPGNTISRLREFSFRKRKVRGKLATHASTASMGSFTVA